MIIRIKVEVLRVAEGCEHTTEVRGDVLQNEGQSHVLSLPRGIQHKVAEGEKRKECHVVRNQHGTEKGNRNKGEDGSAQIPRHADDPTRERGKKPDVPQGTDDGKGGKEAGQRLEIEIIEIGGIRRDKARGDPRREESDRKDGVLLNQGEDVLYEGGRRSLLRHFFAFYL